MLKELDLKLAACSNGDEKQQIKSSIGQREKKLIGVYRQVRWWYEMASMCPQYVTVK